jgi:flagellar assembly protein FliH
MYLSKQFIPQYSQTDEESKKFSPRMHPQTSPSSSQALDWSQLQFREEKFIASPALREIEEKIIKAAREKAVFIEKEAYEKGFAQGERDGQELGQKRIETALEPLHLLLQEMNRLPEDLHRRLERELVQIILTIVRKILHQDSLLPEGTIVKTLQEAFRFVVERKKVLIHLNPKDFAYLNAHLDFLPFSMDGEDSAGIKLLADPAVQRGGCFLETTYGDIDATLNGQLDQITSALWSKNPHSAIFYDDSSS